MYRVLTRSALSGTWIIIILALTILPTMVLAQNVFSFAVNNLEAYERSGNWIYDADNTGAGLFFSDGQHFTYNATTPLHYFSEQKVHVGTTPGKETTITCFGSTHPLALDPSLVKLVFEPANEFELVSFRRVNTTNPLLPWAAAGQAGDVRVYSNAKGHIEYNNVPVLFLKNATFEITTPYPTEAALHSIPGFGTWQGDIGSGAFIGTYQTGFGFGDLDMDLSTDPAWTAPFAAADYKIKMSMENIISATSVDKAWFIFTLNVSPATLASNPVNAPLDMNLPFPVIYPFVLQNLEVNLIDGVEGGEAADLSTFYVNEVKQTPDGAFPVALQDKPNKYWQIGTTLSTFKADLLLKASVLDLAKGKNDWTVVTRVIGTNQWYSIPDFVALNLDPLDALMQFVPWDNIIDAWEVKNVQRALEFSLAKPDVPLPVTLASFNATVNSQNLIALAWTTSSETSLRGFKVYYNTSSDVSNASCLTPVIILPDNTSMGANYSFTASDLTEPATYYFWLEAISMDGSSDFFGPISKTISNTDTPAFPSRNLLSDAYPNPFRAGYSSSFKVDLKAGESGEITVYNVTGQVVKTMPVTPGYHTLNWDGKDSKGNSCSSGIYFYKLSSPSLSQTKKLVIIK
ncbi:MAG: T9SS type A sorting domain-containing protein [Candidatus Cloacimonetes bacterium]|nr:T9SS type A sorting domain-containing protein [Candidatus Cloacimonadota bacterium]MDD3236245.1 T9SS type A sorting domain-containing protein [Candidatus Cloacimonadota bacterium]